MELLSFYFLREKNHKKTAARGEGACSRWTAQQENPRPQPAYHSKRMRPSVGASLLAMVVNDNACALAKRGALESIASKLAPTGRGALESIVGTPPGAGPLLH